MDPRIQAVISTIESDFSCNTLNSEKLARLVHLSPSRLQHLFKAEMGEPPMHYLKSRRMRAVEILLRTEFLSGKELMNRVGLINYSNFIHDFRRAYGMAPGRYRMSIRSRVL